MTVRDIRNLIISADENAQHYWTSKPGADFTVWREYSLLPHTSDDLHAERWAFQIDRFAAVEFDDTAERIRAVLDAAPGVSYSYRVDFEGTPEKRGLIHHIFDCQG